jgi:fatty acid/phospholipid biosynthesis enzyme
MMGISTDIQDLNDSVFHTNCHVAQVVGEGYTGYLVLKFLEGM